MLVNNHARSRSGDADTICEFIRNVGASSQLAHAIFHNKIANVVIPRGRRAGSKLSQCSLDDAVVYAISDWRSPQWSAVRASARAALNALTAPSASDIAIQELRNLS
jgi:hypothetical protein